MSIMFKPLQVGAILAPNRFFMPPITRIRATQFTHVPGDLMIEHYAARASAGLIIAEATMVQENHSAFLSEPGIYNQEQIDAWSKLTKAVHDKGGHIFLQLVHGGKTVVPTNNKTPMQPIAPSAFRIEKHHVPAAFNLTGEKIDYAEPRALEDSELPGIVAIFVRAAKNAIAAGFDGVEFHNGHGYLLDQFLRSSTNKRPPPYGGSTENRARFPLEVISAAASAIGPERVGVRISPLDTVNGMIDEDPVALTAYFASKLSELKIAYLHVVRKDFYNPTDEFDVVTPAREHFKGVLIANGDYTPEEAEKAVAAGKADAVAFGSLWLANPDLIDRVKAGAKFNAADWATFYTTGPEGYNDYPVLGEVSDSDKAIKSSA